MKTRTRTRAVVFTMLAALLFTLLPIRVVKADAVTPQILSLQQTGGTDTTIMVSWSVKYASSVEVWIQDESAPSGQKQFTRSATVNTTSYRFTGLVPGNTYDVMIVAINGENTKLRSTRTLYGIKTAISSMGNVY
ncbi:MAG: fibronectin type III domain-containing protein, partial [Lachnospiraceae bacterium]|nr:fibronectin type III domain-containing protein [Lachnospiraceae bacterium]